MVAIKTTAPTQIPVIDISTSNPDAPQQLLYAASRHGFVFIKNNDAGVDPGDIDFMFRLSEAFFSASTEVKQAVSISSNKAGKNHGWLSRGVEKLDPQSQQRPDVKEAFNLGQPIGLGKYEQPIPEPLEPYVMTLYNFQNACHQLCQRILRHLATALGIDEDWFATRHEQPDERSSTVFRMLFYPQQDTSFEEGVDIRAGAHSDYGSITLLFQLPGQPGLEIKALSGEWTAVPVNPNNDDSEPLPILVNIGDLLQDWTGGLLKSTVHRVIFPKEEAGGDRYSMAYFCHPLDKALLEPVPSTVVQDNIKRTGKETKVITAGEHLMERLAATYNV
ncbi:oxidoreductase [Polychaeton citri CBS 116435]|uniref:Oxidoreductase n=1 Tax=Polychaeton citri CBS 116435 TaxID=1314669 RepID=A0A9P4USC5_9PEZI|nr:oxidoreductase [Polychaeton citri CBS 116435]